MRSISLTEVLYRAEQGRTRPYVCQCEDGETYFVKGRSATRQGLVCELLCAELASRLDLPVPEAVVAVVPPELVAASIASHDGLSLDELGPGAAFGSRKVSAVEFRRTYLDQVPFDLRARVAAFDWWIQNSDRSLTIKGGNVNLLWGIEENELVVIDHNLAFDSDFDADTFSETHVFCDDFHIMKGDFDFRESLRASFCSVLPEFDQIVATIPPEWSFIDPEQTVPAKLDLARMRATLARCLDEEFWAE
jgi:hypothetical protein